MPRKFDCPQCGWKGHPAFELTDKGKLAAKCGAVTCGYMDPKLSPADFNEGIASKNGVETVVSTKSEPMPEAAVTPIRRPAPVPPAVIGQNYNPADVIGSIRDRFLTLSAEIARIEGIKHEHKALEKMLRAAGAWPIKPEIAEAAE